MTGKASFLRAGGSLDICCLLLRFINKKGCSVCSRYAGSSYFRSSSKDGSLFAPCADGEAVRLAFGQFRLPWRHSLSPGQQFLPSLCTEDHRDGSGRKKGLNAVLRQALVSYCVTRPAALTMDRSTYLDPTCPGLKFTQ
jgi:hypothetical protein